MGAENSSSGKMGDPEFIPGGSFDDFFERLRSLPSYQEDEANMLHQEEPVSLEALTGADFSLLFRRVRMFPASTQTIFYTGFLEGIGYHDMSAMGAGVSRLSRINWFAPQPELTIELIEKHARDAYQNFCTYSDEVVKSKLMIVTDFDTALKVQEMLNKRDHNSYGYAHRYTESISDFADMASGKQAEKHKAGDDWLDSTRVRPQDFVSYEIIRTAEKEAQKVVDKTTLTLEGTVGEVKERHEQLPRALTPSLRTIVDGYLASLDVGEEPNRYESVIALFELGVIPLGGIKGEFFVFIPNLPHVDPATQISTSSSNPQAISVD